MLKEFKQFAARGNVIDLAVGVIIGRVDFRNLYVALNGQHYASLAEAQKAGAPTINYGIFFNTIVEFLIVAFVVFLLVRQVNKWMPPPAVAPGEPRRDCPYCASSIPVRARRCPFCTSEVKEA